MSNIIYAPKSWNPISGCSPVSEGCANCWAKVMARRQRQDWGAIYLHPERLEQPLRWRKPKTVAVAFMGDLWHDQVPDEFIDKVFAVMALTPQHTYLLLTKRPERMRAYLAALAVDVQNWPLPGEKGSERIRTATLIQSAIWPLPNVWLGVSCENQARADERIPLLLDTPAAHRWISCEPLLSAIALGFFKPAFYTRGGRGRSTTVRVREGLDWCVIGGESGPHARPCDLGWIRDIRDQCKAAGVPCYVKQMGAKPVLPDTAEGAREWHAGVQIGAIRWPAGAERWLYGPDGRRAGYALWFRDRKGENPDEWPADLRVREMPEELKR